MGLIFFLGYALGSVVVYVLMKVVKSKTDGTLNIVIDSSEQEGKPYLYLELDHSVDKVGAMKEVKLNVRKRKYTPR